MIDEGKKTYYIAMGLLQMVVVIGALIVFTAGAKQIKSVYVEDIKNTKIMEESRKLYRYREGAEVTGVDIVELIGNYDLTYKYTIINNVNSIKIKTASGNVGYSKENYMRLVGSEVEVVGTAGVNKLVVGYSLEDVTNKVFKESLNKTYRVVEMPVDIIGGDSKVDVSNEFIFVLEE